MLFLFKGKGGGLLLLMVVKSGSIIGEIR